MSIWWTEFHNYLLDAFIDPYGLFGNFFYYTIIGLLLAFTFGIDTDGDYFKLFKFVSLTQTGFGLIINCTRLNEPRQYLIRLSALAASSAPTSSSKIKFNWSDIFRNVFLLTFAHGLFRIFISFWYSLMVYPISGLRGGVERFLVYWLALFCQTMATFTLATSISAATSDRIHQVRNAALAFTVVVLFSGEYYEEDSVSWILLWIQYLSSSYYERCALANNQYDDYTINDKLSGDQILAKKHAVGLGLWGSIGALMGLFLLFYCTTNLIFIYNMRKHLKFCQTGDNLIPLDNLDSTDLIN